MYNIHTDISEYHDILEFMWYNTVLLVYQHFSLVQYSTISNVISVFYKLFQLVVLECNGLIGYAKVMDTHAIDTIMDFTIQCLYYNIVS